MSEGKFKEFIHALELTSMNNLNAEALRGIVDEANKDFQPFKCEFNLIVELCPKTDLPRSEINASHCMQCLQEEAINKAKAFKKWFGEKK